MRTKRKAWGWRSLSVVIVLLHFSGGGNGLFHVDVQTVNRPVPGQPVNLEIVVEPPFSSVIPNLTSSASVLDPVTILPEDDRRATSGHSLRRGIFNFQPQSQPKVPQPNKINIQIPGKLPFNPFNLFNMDTLKSLVQSVTENLTGNKKAYSTGFEDSVTIISEDPQRPVPRALNSPFTLPQIQIVDNAHQPSRIQHPPYVRLPTFQTPIIQGQTSPHPQNGLQRPLSSPATPATTPQIPAPPPAIPSAVTPQSLLTEESMINKQMETLNEVLTHEMNSKDHRMSTTIAPLTFPFLPDLSALSQLFNWGEQGARTLAVCNACRVGFGLFVSRARQGGNLANLMELATFGCTFFRITSPEMCKGLVSRFGPILHYMVMEKPSLSAERFCGISLQSSGCTTTDADSHWKIDLTQYSLLPLDSPQGDRLKNSNSNNNNLLEVNNPRRRNFVEVNSLVPVRMSTYFKGVRTLKVLHLTDIHVDMEYATGAMTDCENEMCCHNENGKGPPGKRAGYYGDYHKCDLPFHSYMDALQHISSTHPDIDLIYLTGDFVPHNIWNTSIAGNVETLVNASQYIHQFFPRAKVIPVIGNHETHPVNMFSPFGVPGEFSTDWLYSAAARAWSTWIPKESIHNFLHAGFYDVEINPYFRVIVLNTNLCYGYNFWQAFEPRDPGGQLRWLARELQRSEDVGQVVHIIGHVAPSEADCFTVWSQNFYEIINRYSSTVKAQFYGHTHFDEFKLYYHSYNRSQAISPVWIGASLTPYTNLNPGYKIFTVDGARGAESSWNILDHETWIYNLTEANHNPHLPPRWFKLYVATDAFELPDMSPESLGLLVQRMSGNVSAFNNYYRLYHKATDAALEEGCDALCRKNILCSIVTPHYGEQKMCVQLQSAEGQILPAGIFAVGGDSPLVRSSFGTRSSTDSPFQRVLSFGRSLLRALG